MDIRHKPCALLRILVHLLIHHKFGLPIFAHVHHFLVPVASSLWINFSFVVKSLLYSVDFLAILVFQAATNYVPTLSEDTLQKGRFRLVLTGSSTHI